jgi:hypothetical protein
VGSIVYRSGYKPRKIVIFFNLDKQERSCLKKNLREISPI